MNETGQFLQEACETIAKEKPTAIGIFFLLDDGTSYAYYHKMDSNYKSIMACRIFQDSVMDRIEANPDWLREVLEDET